MSNYLITHYKGTYRIKAPYDLSTNQFARKLDGTLEDIDCYIDCYNKIQIFSYGHGVLEAYIPSIGRGKNIIKAIKEELGENVIFDVVITDAEVLFKFNARNMTVLEKYLKPKTSGANISPFSTKNLPKQKYTIPDEDLNIYKNIIETIPQNQRITVAHTLNSFLKALATRKNTWEDIKNDMARKGLKGKEYIHCIGQWNNYIKYLKEELC